MGKKQGLSDSVFVEIYRKIVLAIILHAHEVWGKVIASKSVRDDIDLVGSGFLRKALRVRSTPRALLYIAAGSMPLSHLIVERVINIHVSKGSVKGTRQDREALGTSLRLGSS